jgi:hypothetical protein
MLYLDAKYVLLVSHRLRNFKRKSEYLFNCSCPFCGDSKTRQRAARGYFYRKADQLNYDCKKCGRGMSAKNFIKSFDPALYEEMQLELFTPRKTTSVLPDMRPERPIFDKSLNPLKGLSKISTLPKDHFCRQYVMKRAIPEFYWDDLYFTSKFYTWCGYVLPGRYKVPKDRDDEPRLVIPLRNQNGKIIGFQGRQLVGEDIGQKYVFLIINKDEPPIWGMDKVDQEKQIYVFEGPIDAMFVPNALACGGGDLVSTILKTGLPREKLVIVYDNEPRKATTIKKINKAIDAGLAVCIWPEISEKDVNQMVLSRIQYGISAACQFVFTKIRSSIYSGITAKMALSTWKRIENAEKEEKKSRNRTL